MNMEGQLTVRLPEELNRGIAVLAKRLHLKRADIVRMALEKFLEESQGVRERIPYESVKHLLGSVSTGVKDLGESHREHLLKKLKRNA
jgi:hypothetical protein